MAEIKKRKPKFQRTDAHKYSKLGIRRKKKQIYRKAKGRDNKIRLNMKGHVRKVRVGFRTKKIGRDLVRGLRPVRICNLKELKNITKEEIGIIAKVGKKKKIELADYALKNNIRLLNLNSKKFLEETEAKRKKAKEEKTKKLEKRKVREKKAKESEKKKKEDEKTKKDEKEGKKETIEDKIEKSEEKEDKIEKSEEKKEETKDKKEDKIEKSEEKSEEKEDKKTVEDKK